MKRYLPSSRTSSNLRNTSALGDQLIREFTQQAQAVMQQLSAQFTSDLQSQSAQILRNQLSSSNATSGFDNQGNSFGPVGQLLSTATRYLVSRPQTTQNSIETARSVDAAQFRPSSAQIAAEAQAALSKGDKNT